MFKYGCYFDVHGFPVRMQTDDEVVFAAAREALCGFQVMDQEPDTYMSIVMQAVEDITEVPIKPSESAQLIRETPTDGVTVSCTLYRDEPGWLLDFDQAGRMALDFDNGRVEGWLVQPGRMALDWAASFVLLAAIELLRSKGLYAIHGAGLERNGKGVLIVGFSGAGKTTSCISLMRAGYGCLSDDHPILHTAGAEPILMPFPGRLAVTDKTIDWFAELAAAREGFRSDTRKHSFELQEIDGFIEGRPCPPKLIVFPRIVDWPESFFEEMPKPRALEELLPQTLLVLDPELAKRQFQAMADLVLSTPVYRLHFGEDVTQIPELFDRLLDSID